MEITKSEMYDKNIRFKDAINTPCRVGVYPDGTLRLTMHGPISSNVFFTQEDIKSLLPYLQAFAETGRLELPLQALPLQGGELTDAFEPENLIKVSAEQNIKIYEQEKRIKTLERLVKEWSECATTDDYPFSCFDELQEQTNQLLGEENDSAS